MPVRCHGYEINHRRAHQNIKYKMHTQVLNRGTYLRDALVFLPMCRLLLDGPPFLQRIKTIFPGSTAPDMHPLDVEHYAIEIFRKTDYRFFSHWNNIATFWSTGQRSCTRAGTLGQNSQTMRKNEIFFFSKRWERMTKPNAVARRETVAFLRLHIREKNI